MGPGQCCTANLTLCKFHTVKNWYQFLTAHENLVPMPHIFRTNVSHFVKIRTKLNTVVHIHRIDTIPSKLLHFMGGSRGGRGTGGPEPPEKSHKYRVS